jgi:hypothetical protein
LLAEWERISDRLDRDDEGGLLRERLAQGQEARLAKARQFELRCGLGTLAGAFFLFLKGYLWRDKLPEVG